MWRIGSQMPPSRMMIPCGATVGAGAPATGWGDAVAAEAGPASATTAGGKPLES